MPKFQSAYTLIELVIVITLVGVAGLGASTMIQLGAQVFAESSDRQSTIARSRFSMERLTQELRSAVPNSVRLSCETVGPSCGQFQCIEFVPFKVSSGYIDEATSGTTLDVVEATGVNVGDYVIINPLFSNDVYDASRNHRLPITAVNKTPGLGVGMADVDVDRWTFSSSFAEDSGQKRAYVVGSTNTVTYCLETTTPGDSHLYRYENYGYLSTQPIPINRVLVGQSGVLMAEGLNQLQPESSVYELFFQLSPATLQRNAIVYISAYFITDSGEALRFRHEVNIPNVP